MGEDFAKFQDYKRTLSRSASQSGSKPHSGSIKSSTRSGVKTPRATAESVSIQVKSSPKMVKNSIRPRRPKANQGCWTRFQKNTQIRYNIGTGAFYAIFVTVALFILGGVGFLGWFFISKGSTKSENSELYLLNKGKNRGGLITCVRCGETGWDPKECWYCQENPNVEGPRHEDPDVSHTYTQDEKARMLARKEIADNVRREREEGTWDKKEAEQREDLKKAQFRRINGLEDPDIYSTIPIAGQTTVDGNINEQYFGGERGYNRWTDKVTDPKEINRFRSNPNEKDAVNYGAYVSPPREY